MSESFESSFSASKSCHLRPGLFPQLERGARVSLHAVLLWTGLSIAVLSLAFLLDTPVDRMLTLGPSSTWTHLFKTISKTGEGWVVAVCGVIATLFLFCRGHSKAGTSAFLIALSGLLTGATATILRSLLGRTRPTSHEVQGFYGIWHDSNWLIGKYEFGGFPSGHAATVIGVAAAAWLIDRRLGLLAFVYAFLVSWSRIALACHHFSDVVAAGIVGIVGAHLIISRMGPGIYSTASALEKGWPTRKSRELHQE
jgi:membrane-associated phospholipid phosphatase